MNRPGYIAIGQMEAITEQILTDYGFDPCDKRVRPVPIEEIVEFHFDLQICWEAIDQLDTEGMVMAAIIPDRKQIILNETHRALFDSKIGTYYFTLAHELGHWVLHASGKPYLRSGGELYAYYCRSTSHKPAEEIQADLFAGCLLMPRPMMERAVKQLNMLGAIQLQHIYGLADCLKVSISALTVRLKQLRLLYVGQDGRVSRADGRMEPEYEQLTMDL
ncbi:ImmA/IrrE family metallo-endopeptidase [Paenibacillus mesophilus]|uniref:ImmA/IrrE family metallo-endopeptidase n=1 Tax=Paenibacillus mesophilus TaxID=2582849 RepID=UPI00110EEBCC|nr:ImmA/IrrE family metallo-endopeptidase [Paenibacillus mesophilus]TMV51584.1 ImmA/IrrE family metallo-endopeptidase [Paenibacillus mesophilus]